ncbi:protein Wiz-like [Archocentrus centrarchus]|uniref:protein Wiz-like n=1 Tax=Archocentrus centrarchus TaxID=63155 RepID=UPI0011EA17F0|nr:protein Wiz-like [Archocentrus centrarchus]
MDSLASPQPVMCEVCGTYFETRRGLSSHARLHLRKLGVTVSESSGAPIELLYQITRERYGSLPDFKSDSFLHVSVPQKITLQQESKPPPEEEDTNTTYKTGVGLLTTSQIVDHQGSAANLNESSASVLPSTPPPVKPAEGSSSSSSERTAAAKPLWAPRETDAPITLASDPRDEVYVCELCGCWYETRKGLASHARAHLRQIGISDSDIKGSPIDLLYQIMEEEDLKPVDFEKKEELPSNSPPRSSSKRPSTQSPPPESSSSKRPKISEECTCILCGEEFENRKGLASHARSHLRHIGMSELVGKNSAIDAVQDLVSSGMLEAVHTPKTNNTASSSAAPSPAPPFPEVPAQSSGPSQSWTPFSSTPLSTSPEKISQSPQAPVNRAPKAKKGFRLAVDPLHRKPKPEPVETEVSVQLKASTSESSSPVQNLAAAVISAKPSESASTDVPSPPTVLCEFCGQLFDTRKALSCHARAHLRQLGLTWSIKTSPIDLLKEVMMHGEEGRKELSVRGSTASGKGSWSSQGSRRSLDSLTSGERASNSPLDYSMKEKSSFSKSGVIHLDTSCELCGFDFENRKALASHARAHLRQLGIIEWKADGATSPIELLSELIKRDPAKVSEITKRYRMGDLYIKKSQRTAPSPSPSTDSDSVVGSSLKSSMQHREHKASRKEYSNYSVRSSRGVHLQKHGASTGRENQNRNSQQPPRSGNIPALLPKPPLTPLVKLVGKIYSLKCRFCEEVFQGPLSVQEQWITHLQKHILSLGCKDKTSPPATPVTTPALVHPVAV